MPIAKHQPAARNMSAPPYRFANATGDSAGPGEIWCRMPVSKATSIFAVRSAAWAWAATTTLRGYSSAGVDFSRIGPFRLTVVLESEADSFGRLITRGCAMASSFSCSCSASESQSSTLSSSVLVRGTSNFSPHFLQRALRPWNSTGRRYFAAHLGQLHLMKSATTHLVPPACESYGPHCSPQRPKSLPGLGFLPFRYRLAKNSG